MGEKKKWPQTPSNTCPNTRYFPWHVQRLNRDIYLNLFCLKSWKRKFSFVIISFVSVPTSNFWFLDYGFTKKILVDLDPKHARYGTVVEKGPEMSRFLCLWGEASQCIHFLVSWCGQHGSSTFCSSTSHSWRKNKPPHFKRTARVSPWNSGQTMENSLWMLKWQVIIDQNKGSNSQLPFRWSIFEGKFQQNGGLTSDLLLTWLL